MKYFYITSYILLKQYKPIEILINILTAQPIFIKSQGKFLSSILAKEIPPRLLRHRKTSLQIAHLV